MASNLAYIRLSRFGLLGLLLLLLLPSASHAQNCDPNVPSFTIDFTGHPDSTWTSPATVRSGKCCGVGGSDRCILFYVTLDTMSAGIIVDLSGGTGSTIYQLSCGNSTVAGSGMCINGVGPHAITLCKPGNNAQTYTVTSIPKPHARPKTVYVSKNCNQQIVTEGFVESTITWKALGDSSLIRYLSCKSGCDTTTVSADDNFPAYVDYQICGTAVSSCLTGTRCDTIRAIFVEDLDVAITDSTPAICYGSTTTTLHAQASGGMRPYTYLWSNGSTDSFATVGTGTAWVKVQDAFGCDIVYDTVQVVGFTSPPSVGAGNDTTICTSANFVFLNGTVNSPYTAYWSGGGGLYIPNNTTLNARYIPSNAELSQGYAELTLNSSGHDACPGTTDKVRITIKASPSPVINGNSTACLNATTTYSVTKRTGHQYHWTVVNGAIQSGQNTNAISVLWDKFGPGFIYLTETNAAGCTSTVAFKPLVHYDFNTNSVREAKIGPDATGSDPNAISDGVGMTILSNCGTSRGLDLNVTGSRLNRGSLCMSFRFQHDEADATFFSRNGVLLNMGGGQLYVSLKVKDTNGVVTTTGPSSTNYTLPSDAQFRNYTLCYDSMSGIAQVHIDTLLIWSDTLGSYQTLDWTGAGDAKIGQNMDGNCSKATLLDYASVSVPVTILPSPNPVIVGIDSVCAQVGAHIYNAGSTAGNTYSWSITNGNILSSTSATSVTVEWTVPGVGTLTVTETNSFGCPVTKTYNVQVHPKPGNIEIQH